MDKFNEASKRTRGAATPDTLEVVLDIIGGLFALACIAVVALAMLSGCSS